MGVPFPSTELVRCYKSVDGSEVHLNVGSSYALACPLDTDVLMAEVALFRRLQMEWFRHLMLSAIDDKNAAGHTQIFGTKGTIVAGLTARYFRLHRFLFKAISHEAWDIAGVKDYADPSRSLVIPYLSTKRQSEFIECLLKPDDILELINLVRPELVPSLIFPELEKLIEDSESVNSFLDELAARASAERAVRSDDRSRLPNVRPPAKSAIPDAFLFFLCQQGFLLRPIVPRVFCSETYDLESWVMEPRVRLLWKKVHESFVATTKRADSDAMPTPEKLKGAQLWERHLLQAFLITISSSDVRKPNLISANLFQDMFEIYNASVDSKKIPDMFTSVFRAMRDQLSPEMQGPMFESRRSMWGRDPFDWTRMVFSPSTRTRFPEGFQGPYTPTASILTWQVALSDALKRIGVKTLGSHRATCNVFLSWLVASRNKSSDVTMLTREEMSDGKAPTNSICFRSFLQGRGTTIGVINGHLARISALFDLMIADLDNPIPNPIVLRFDLLREAAKRGKTPRRSLGREMLDYIRAFNSRDDFAFSKNRPAHHRVLMNRGSMRYERVWFPGVAYALDFLLRLPLRGFQVRYLDSGEGDEFVPDMLDPGAVMVRNETPTATKGRRQGVLTFIDGLQGQPLLGLFINTNKSNVDCNEGYEIPWCEDGLREAILKLVAWQARWNPIQRPVMCVEKNHSPTNPEVEALIQRTYALFRDPSEAEGWPISRDAIYRYWDDLCAAVEDELNSTEDGSKNPVRLTDCVVLNKGKGKTEKRRTARYDIHTLRVSGISALIEAGMPPDLVAQVAGHSSVVMTLYYNVIAASALNERLKAALLRTATDLDSLDSFRADDFEKVSEFLVNRRSAEDVAGLAMLRERMGHGDGSFDVMSHGICPGGECSSGGEWANQTVGHLAVPRPLACSLCRYRLTGPMFLPGLVLNANRLMHELRRKGQEIADLNAERQILDPAQSRRAATLKGRIEALYKETSIIAEEWSAEVQYVHAAKDLLDAYMASYASASNDPPLPAMMGAQEQGVAVAKLEARSDFALLQSLSEGASSWIEFRPTAALADHREFLNEVLAANEIDPFLLRLSGKARDEAANLLGRALTSMVPDAEIDSLRDEASLQSRYPAVLEVVTKLQAESRLALSQSDARPLAYLDEVG